ncbi:MAG: phosphate ABC transporter permease [Microcystaceae cyanobacterium]
MLVPLTRETLENLVPVIATGTQYTYYWGKWKDFLRRLLISFVALTITWLLGKLIGGGGDAIKLIFDVIAGLYWLWSPVYIASVRNNRYRRYGYCGFWRGRVLDVYITEELLGEEETVNKAGELVIVENRERRINLEIGDRNGFRARVQSPIQRRFKGINVQDIAEVIIFSNKSDLSRIEKISDVYLPQSDIWVGDYPCVRRDVFYDVREELGVRNPRSYPQRNRRIQGR